MGYSTGGDVALLLADRSPLIDAVIGLDASWTLNKDDDVSTSSLFRAERHAEPILVLRRPFDEDATGGPVLEQLSGAPRVVAEVPGADHGSFSDDPTELVFLGNGTAGDGTTHATIARASLDFLDAALGRAAGFDGRRLADGIETGGCECRSCRRRQRETGRSRPWKSVLSTRCEVRGNLVSCDAAQRRPVR